MSSSPLQHPSKDAAGLARFFADLRRRNEQAARIAQFQEARRERQVEQVIRADQQRRVRQAH